MRPSRLRIGAAGGGGFKSGWAIGSNFIIGVYAMKKNVASQIIGASMVSATDGSAFTGSVTVYVTGDGGTQAAGSVGAGACTHEGNGFHTYVPAQAETNYDHIGFTFTGTGAVPATVQVFPTFPQTGDSFARIGAPVGASISADIAIVDTVVDGIQTDLSNGTDGLGAIKADTAAILVDTGTTLDAKIDVIDGIVDSILLDTAEIGTAGAGLTNIPERGKYAMGCVWIGPNANTNTTSYVDGITTNPVSTLAAAKTIADALSLRRFFATRSGTVQIAAAMVGYDFQGTAWSCTTTGGSRDVSSSSFFDAKVVGGTYASTSAESHWDDCEFSDGVSIAAAHFTRCTFAGTLTLNAAGNYDFVDCASIVAGTSAPVFAVPIAGVVNISFRRWSGGIRITGITSSTTISIDAVSGGTVTLEGVDGNVQVRGMVTVTDSRTGTPTLGTNQVINQSAISDAVWDEPTAGHTTAGTTGKALTDATAPTAAAVADAVWDEALAGHLGAGSTGEALNAAGDPWTTALPGAYGAGSAGYIIGTNIDAPISTVDTVVDLIKVDTSAILVDTADMQPKLGAPAGASISADIAALPTATENADALLNRDMSAVTDTTARSPLNAFRFLRNKYSIAGTTLTVTKEDDVATAWTSELTTSANADPVTGSDPA